MTAVVKTAVGVAEVRGEGWRTKMSSREYQE